MAKETATLTFTLEDEFSAKFQEIVGKLEDFQRRMGDVTDRGKKGFQEVGEKVKQVGDHSSGVNASLMAMKTHMADAFSAFNKAMGQSIEGLSKFQGNVEGMGSSLAGLARHFGTIGKAVGAIGSVAAAAAGSIYLLNRHLAAAYNETVNLETRLGMGSRSIETVVQIFERMGKSREGALSFLEEWNKAIEESFEGSGSRIYKALRTGIQGEAGVNIANIFQETFEKIRAGIISKEDGIREALERIGPQPEWAERKIAEALHTTTDVIHRWIEESKNIVPPTIFSDQVLEAMKHLNREMADGFQRIRNAWTKGWNELGEEGVKKNEEAMKHLNEQIAILAEKLPAAFTAGVQAAGALLTAVNKVVDAIKYVLEHIEGVYGKSPEEAARIREENRKKQEEEHKRRYHERAPAPPPTAEEQAAAAAADAERARRAEAARASGNIPLAESIEKYRREHPVGTPQRFGAYGGADLSGLRINQEAFDKAILTPENIARGRSRIEYRPRDFTLADIQGAVRGAQDRGAQDRGVVEGGPAGGQPIVLTQMAESQRQTADISRESSEYLRDIRDIMKWLQDQLQGGQQQGGQGAGAGAGAGAGGLGGGGAGGMGFGGALGGFAGGGAGRARTGAPWFGGTGGRGTGGVPAMAQGGPGAGQNFYNQALAQVKASGLVGQVPPDGAQFGITSGSAEEWARFMTGVAKAESNFNPRSANTSDPGGSFGVLQYAHNQVPGGNAYDTNASIQAFIRDAQQAIQSGGIRSPASLLRRRFSTIGSHPERTIRNLVNYGAPATAGAGDGGAITDRPGTTGPSVSHVAGTVNLAGQVFHWGSGGRGRGSIPFGTFPINPAWTGQGQLGDIGRQIGSIATIGGRGGEIMDPRVGMRAGIQIHRGSSDDLERLYSAGCFAIAPSDWPRFKQTLMAEVAKHPEGLYLNVNRNGQAFIGPRGQQPQLVGQVGQGPTARVQAGEGARGQQYRGLASAMRFGGAEPGSILRSGEQFEPTTGLPSQRRAGREEAMRLGAQSARQTQEAIRAALADDRAEERALARQFGISQRRFAQLDPTERQRQIEEDRETRGEGPYWRDIRNRRQRERMQRAARQGIAADEERRREEAEHQIQGPYWSDVPLRRRERMVRRAEEEEERDRRAREQQRPGWQDVPRRLRARMQREARFEEELEHHRERRERERDLADHPVVPFSSRALRDPAQRAREEREHRERSDLARERADLDRRIEHQRLTGQREGLTTGGAWARRHARAGEDRALGANGGGKADINVNVTAPRGDKVSTTAKGHGMLAEPKVKTSATGQMRSAGQNAKNEPNQYGEE